MPYPKRHAIVIGLVLAAAVVLVGGCGGAVPMGAAKSADSAPEPATIEEAQAQLDQARAELEGRAPKSESSLAPSTAGAPPASVPSPSPPAPPPPTTTATGGVAQGAESPGAGSECVTRCRALASMRRAVAAICRMAGDDDSRCTDAKRVLQESEARVASCGC